MDEYQQGPELEPLLSHAGLEFRNVFFMIAAGLTKLILVIYVAAKIWHHCVFILLWKYTVAFSIYRDGQGNFNSDVISKI